MSRLEIIHLRLADGNSEVLVQDILQSTTMNEGHPDLLIYRRVQVTTDISIHLVHEKPLKQLPSPTGVRLAAALREHGIVEHSIWAEMKVR